MPSHPQGQSSGVSRINPNRNAALKAAQSLIAPHRLSKTDSALVNIRDQNKSIDWVQDKHRHSIRKPINLTTQANAIVLQAFGEVVPENIRCISCKSGNGVFQTCTAAPCLDNVAFRLRACGNCVWGGRGVMCSLRKDFETGGGVQPSDKIIEWIRDHGGIDYLIATQETIPPHLLTDVPKSRKRKTTDAPVESNTPSDQMPKRRKKCVIVPKPASVDRSPSNNSIALTTRPSVRTLPVTREDSPATDSFELPCRLDAGIENHSRVKQVPLSVRVSRSRPGLATVDAPPEVFVEDMVVQDQSLQDTATLAICELEEYLYRVLAELGHHILVPDCDRSLRDIATLTRHRFEETLFRLLSEFGQELLVHDRRHRLAMLAPTEVESHIHGGHRMAWPVSDEEWQNPEILQMYRGDFTRWTDIITRRLGDIQAVQSQGDDRWTGHDQRYVVSPEPVPSVQRGSESVPPPAAAHFTAKGRVSRSLGMTSSGRSSVRQRPLSLQELDHGKPSAPVSVLPSGNDQEPAAITGSRGSDHVKIRESHKSLDLAGIHKRGRKKHKDKNKG